MIGALYQRSSLSAAFDNRLSFGEKPYVVEKGPYIALPFVFQCVCVVLIVTPVTVDS